MTDGITLQLIHQAQAGQEQALATISERARGKVYIFIYRLTLNLDRTEDLTQETLLEMIKSLDRLSFSHVNLFWAWLRRTALGKVQHSYRLQGSRRVQLKTRADSERLRDLGTEEKTGVDHLIKEELKNAVCDAMRTLTLAHRSILTLRCFEQMSYPEIASVTGQTELQARVQFFRAKQSLKKRLRQRGFGKGHLLAALGAFATLTEGSIHKASVPVTIQQAAVTVGGPAAALGFFASKAGVATLVLVIAGTIAGGRQVSEHWKRSALERAMPLQRAYRVFAEPNGVIGTYDADGNGWQAYVPPNPLATVSLPVLEAILTRRQPTNPLWLSVPEDHWVHLEYAGPLVDGPGIDVLLDARNSASGPRLFVTDGADREVEISPASRQPTGQGFSFIGYDLAGLNVPFEPRAVRLRGAGTTSAGNALELWVVRARIEPGL